MTTAEPTRKNVLPTLETGRLLLRPWSMVDVPVMKALADYAAVARYTSLPHPYGEGDAEKFIGTHGSMFESGKGVVLAISLRETGEAIGCIGLHGDFSTGIAELGYWIGGRFWGKGYCTEAARAIVDYGFRALGLCRVHSRHFGANPASGRVMQKIGMVPEGRRRQHLFRWGEYDDDVLYGMLRAEFELMAAETTT